MAKELVNIALRRIQVLKDHKKVDESIYETYYWDFNAEHFSLRADFTNMPEEVKTAILTVADIVEALAVDDNKLVTAPDDFEVVEVQIAAVECGQMIVRDEGIAFLAIPKHCDFYVTTAEIPVQVLQEAAGIGRTKALQKTVS